jgi:hypothetical protein
MYIFLYLSLLCIHASEIWSQLFCLAWKYAHRGDIVCGLEQVAQSMARVVAPTAEDGDGEGQPAGGGAFGDYDGGYGNSGYGFGGANGGGGAAAKAPSKWVSTCWVDLERVLRALPALALNSAPATSPRVAAATAAARSGAKGAATAVGRKPRGPAAAASVPKKAPAIGPAAKAVGAAGSGAAAASSTAKPKLAGKTAAVKTAAAQPPAALLSPAGAGGENAPPTAFGGDTADDAGIVADAASGNTKGNTKGTAAVSAKPLPLGALSPNKPVAAKKSKVN